MRLANAVFAAGAIAIAGVSLAPAQMAGHTTVTPAQVKWGPAPPSIPAGAQLAVLYGDPNKDGMFVMRLKFPKGLKLAPHTHPKPEIVTVISGTMHLGTGRTADPSKAQAMTVGSFFAMDPGMEHYGAFDEETVVQINSTGPWGITYVNPTDDPRTKQ
jgi:quercetin dioxygenase-like cupin family protein